MNLFVDQMHTILEGVSGNNNAIVETTGMSRESYCNLCALKIEHYCP
jgi:hypothetical protein